MAPFFSGLRISRFPTISRFVTLFVTVLLDAMEAFRPLYRQGTQIARFRVCTVQLRLRSRSLSSAKHPQSSPRLFHAFPISRYQTNTFKANAHSSSLKTFSYSTFHNQSSTRDQSKPSQDNPVSPTNTPSDPQTDTFTEQSQSSSSETSSYTPFPQIPESENPSRPSQNPPSLTGSTPSRPPPREPSYEVTFTCNPCRVRSSHYITKHGYHRGTIVISCPSCKSRHIISDHLKIFMDKPTDLEGIMRQHGGLLKKGTLGTKDGKDVEFWEDGTETEREVRDFR